MLPKLVQYLWLLSVFLWFFGAWVFWTNNEGAGDVLWETTTNGLPGILQQMMMDIYGDTPGTLLMLV
jgi:hypothetical protein